MRRNRRRSSRGWPARFATSRCRSPLCRFLAPQLAKCLLHPGGEAREGVFDVVADTDKEFRKRTFEEVRNVGGLEEFGEIIREEVRQRLREQVADKFACVDEFGARLVDGARVWPDPARRTIGPRVS